MILMLSSKSRKWLCKYLLIEKLSTLSCSFSPDSPLGAQGAIKISLLMALGGQKYNLKGTNFRLNSRNNNFITRAQLHFLLEMGRGKRNPSSQSQGSSPEEVRFTSSSRSGLPPRRALKRGTIEKDPKRRVRSSGKGEIQIMNRQFDSVAFDELGFKGGCEVVEKLQKLWEEVRIFGNNPDQENISWGRLCRQINKVRNESTIILLKSGTQNALAYFKSNNDQQFLHSQEPTLIPLSEEEASIWEGVCQIQDSMQSGAGMPGLKGVIEPLITMSESFAHIFQKAASTRTQQNQTEEEEIENIFYRNTESIAHKTFAVGLREDPIDELSYFRLKECEEGHYRGIYRPITNMEDWSKFIQKRRNKKRKGDRFLLHTTCQTCLSPYTEDANPIITCPECHLRNHRLCLDLTSVDRCGRCIYSRLANKVKSQTPSCFLCERDDLTPIRINFSTYCHIFCLMSLNLWTIRNECITMDRQKVQDFTEKAQPQTCHSCKKKSQYCVECEHCDKKYHPLCAYLEGYRVIAEQGSQARVDCSAPDDQRRLSDQRRYTCNYNNLVFKKLNNMKGTLKRRKNQEEQDKDAIQQE